MPILELSNVSKHFGGAEVLQDVNLAVEEGEFVAIVGYSGAGKTTLVSLLAGLLMPDDGSVRFDGQPVRGPGPERGIVFQNYSLLPWLTVVENIRLAVETLHPEWTRSDQTREADRFVAMVNLASARDRRPSELSGGMRQRVSLARTLALQPRVLLLDEPLGALDALTRATLQGEIARLRFEQKQTVVLITNDPDEAILLADRVVPLSRGPRATLGPSIPVELPYPRERKALHEDPEFRRLRSRVYESLLASGSTPRVTVSRKLVLPDLEPEDLSRPRPVFGRQHPIRRSEQQRVDVDVEVAP